MADKYDWIAPYKAIATALLDYEDNKDKLAEIVSEILNETYTQMDPFTFFSMFNGKLKKFNRRSKAVATIIDKMNLDVTVPQSFEGLPVTNPLRWRYWGPAEGMIENNWQLFKAALAYAENQTDETTDAFIHHFNVVLNQPNIGYKSLTMALYWARPEFYLPLDTNTIQYLNNRYSVQIDLPLDGAKYLALLNTVRARAETSFPQLSFAAWELNGWIPAPSEFNPGITAEGWGSLLSDPQVGTPNVLRTLACLLASPDGATCTQLAQRYGESKNLYLTNIANLGKKASKQLNIKPRNVNGKDTYWSIPCIGNYVKGEDPGWFAWKLRPELAKALESIDLPPIDLPVPTSFDLDKLKHLIELYKADFPKFRGPSAPNGDQEAYKWDDLLAYRNNWDIDADDFAAHFRAALYPAASGQGALLGSSYDYPFRRLEKLIAFDQESVRAAFDRLYSNTGTLEDACRDFMADIDYVLEQYNAAHADQLPGADQNPSAVSVYLAFEQPERYHIHKPRVSWRFADSIGATLPHGAVDKFVTYEHLCQDVMPYIMADKELVAMSDAVLTQEQRDADPAHHMLLQDITFYSWYYKPIFQNEGEDPATMPATETPTYPKNLILYGPPGTGKTYQSKAYAVAICDRRAVKEVLEEMTTREGENAVYALYRELEKQERIGFVTFHQSYSYEDFIEGLRPEFVKNEEDENATGSLQYPVKDGTFLAFCKQADTEVREIAKSRDIPFFEDNPQPRIWKFGLSMNEEPNLYTQCKKGRCVRIGWDVASPSDYEDSDVITPRDKIVIRYFQDEIQPGDFLAVPVPGSSVVSVAVVTGGFEWSDKWTVGKRTRKVQWISDIDKKLFKKLNGGTGFTLQTIYPLPRVQISELLEAMGMGTIDEEVPTTQRNDDPYVFVIDEINRGNISQIFGELISLIEVSKRKGEPEELTVRLPYSREPFSVPANVYIVGTMNTADRSIALMDTALRRRFSFVEVMPDPDLIDGLDVEGVDIAQMLRTMNLRIEVLLDREHALGHSMLLPLRDHPNVHELARIFRDNIIPLLQEYFYDDYGKIRSVLGAAADDFLVKRESGNIFWSGDNADYGHLAAYELRPAPVDPATYQKIYQQAAEA